MKLHIIFLLITISLTAGCKYLKEPSLPIEISADDLAAEYKNNAVEADGKYNGQTLIVSGTISHYDVINGIIGVYLTRNESAGEWWVMCFIDKSSQPDAYAKLGRDKTITATGTGHHKKDEFSISLRDCKIE